MCPIRYVVQVFIYHNRYIVNIRLSHRIGENLKCTLSVTSDKATTFDIKSVDINGKLIRKMSQSVAKRISQIALCDFEKLPTGIYLLQMTDERTSTTTVQRLMKN
jgi:Secretion system C-terminal sorting domain